MGEGSSDGDGGSELDSGHILKTEPRRFSTGLHMNCAKKGTRGHTVLDHEKIERWVKSHGSGSEKIER